MCWKEQRKRSEGSGASTSHFLATRWSASNTDSEEEGSKRAWSSMTMEAKWSWGEEGGRGGWF